MQALVRQLDSGKKLCIALDSMQELSGKFCDIPARVSVSISQ